MCLSNLSSAYAEEQEEHYEREPYKTQGHIYYKDTIECIVSYITQWPL